MWMGLLRSGQTPSTFNYSPASAGTYSITVCLLTVQVSLWSVFSCNGSMVSVAVDSNTNAGPQCQAPTPSATTVPATTDNGSTVDLQSGKHNQPDVQRHNRNKPVRQINNGVFHRDRESGTIGFSNITIPISAVPYGTTPTIYIDSQPAQNQGYTQEPTTTTYGTQPASAHTKYPSYSPKLLLPRTHSP